MQEYNYVSSKRISYFLSSKPQPHQFTILVRSVPVSAGISVSNSVERFFKEYHPTTYLSHVVVRRTNKLRYLIVRLSPNGLFCDIENYQLWWFAKGAKFKISMQELSPYYPKDIVVFNWNHLRFFVLSMSLPFLENGIPFLNGRVRYSRVLTIH